MTLEREPRRMRRVFGITTAVLGVVLLVGLSSISSPSAAGPGLEFVGSAMIIPSATEYAVVFTESGLPTGTNGSSGTNWSIALNGTSQNSTTSTITFTEPDGSYLFIVGPVPGFTVETPEINITVAGAPQSFGVLFTSTTVPPPSCPSFFWSGANNTLSGNCIGFFEADYRSFNASTGYTTDNSTFTVGPFAEVSPSGTVVALAVPGFDGQGAVTVTSTPHEINVTDTIVGKATNAIGVNSSTGDPNGGTPLWSPADLPGSGGSTTWGPGPEVLGNLTIQIVFHFENGSANGTTRVKFAVSVIGWPWMSSSDVLGLVVTSEAYALPGGSHFTYTASNDTITQQWDSNDSTITSLAFGPTANTTGSPPSVLQVTDQVGLFPSGATPTEAGALLTFSGAGGYPNMTYDPWVEFGPHAVVPIHPVSGPTPSGIPSLPYLVAIGGVLVGGLLLGTYAHRARRHPIEDGLRQTG
jgi:hypothetical protein